MQSIIAEKRDLLGKKASNLRKLGLLPAVLYGKQQKSEAISVKEADFLKLWKSAGESSVIEVKVGDEKYNALVQDVAIDPLKNHPLHADFYVVDMNKPIKVDVRLEFIGESEAVRLGGILVKVAHELKVEALPKDLPREIQVNISLLKNIGDSLTVKDINLPKGVEVLDLPEGTVVLVEAPRSEEELKSEEDGEGEAPSLENIEKVGEKERSEKEKAEEGIG
jgi:large subunit ribosomal protein L25